VTTFAKLYQMLRKLQSEIEDVMPEFEEQMEELTWVSVSESRSWGLTIQSYAGADLICR
jgi:hypothetical protein